MSGDGSPLGTAPLNKAAERAAFIASLRSAECPACEGSGGRLLDDWGYERDDCRACGGTGLRTVSP